MRNGLLKALLWVNAGIKIVVCRSIQIVLDVVSLSLKMEMRMLIQSEEVRDLIKGIHC